ncbi:hypothetical protein [Mycobacterium leprae]|uniref:hypothetical protein n=1 Tax=Mycobacterium leprae TaxID=1769 RepID=UPI00031663DC|nr:hypothetical protein [Mycobacterium leprae]
MADELQNKTGCTEIWSADFSDSADRNEVYDRLLASVRVLVNYAGFHTYGEFWTTD